MDSFCAYVLAVYTVDTCHTEPAHEDISLHERAVEVENNECKAKNKQDLVQF